jgi:hypothetical protein
MHRRRGEPARNTCGAGCRQPAHPATFAASASAADTQGRRTPPLRRRHRVGRPMCLSGRLHRDAAARRWRRWRRHLCAH